MPLRTIHQAVTQRLEILDHEGNVDKALMPKLSDNELVHLLKLMLRMRAFDEKALNLQRQGRMGTYGSMRGQEAAQAGLVPLINDDDWIIPSIREQGILEARGMPMHLYYAFCKGDERANRLGDKLQSLPPCISIGSQLLHGAGVGMGMKLKKSPGAALTFSGDGATSEGDFHEALNYAGVFRAKTLFYIQNNGWAISVPFAQQTAAESIAQRAHAYGFPGIQVDGNDVLAVYVASRDALEHVRSGKGPYLIEAATYRIESHTTADDHTRYRSADEVAYWKERDPIDRMRKFLVKKKLWNDAAEQAFKTELSVEVEAEVAKLEALTPPAPTDFFDYMYAELTPALQEQRTGFMQEVLG